MRIETIVVRLTDNLNWQETQYKQTIAPDATPVKNAPFDSVIKHPHTNNKSPKYIKEIDSLL